MNTPKPADRQYYLDSVLLPQGWARGAVVTVSESGRIARIEIAPPPAVAGPPPGAERISGLVVPGMPNAHSHAFQRAMAGAAEPGRTKHGRTKQGRAKQDSFWTWRSAMYGLANRIQPEDLLVVATQLFVEMLKAGYTSVAEFHYLHRQINGAPYAGNNALWEAVSEAASIAGIGLTFLPTLYQCGDFGAKPLTMDQARFALHEDEFLRAVGDRVAADRRRGSGTQRTGAAFHSLRAVPVETVAAVARSLAGINPSLPVHIHVAEQLREVLACRKATGRRPVELLLEAGLLTPHWCLVHATHATAGELKGIAAAGATVCVSISTEANLGDGHFDAARFLGMDGRLCIGSDSQCGVDPAEELRWMEYQQRLRRKRRAVLASATEPHVGTRLWRDAAAHGAQAIGQPVGAIAAGRRADWVVLDPHHPALTGAAAESALDHLIFAGAAAAIRDVMVAGRWVVRHGHHEAEAALGDQFATVMSRLGAAGA